MNIARLRLSLNVGLIVCSMFCLSLNAANAGVGEADCLALGHITLQTGSGISIELDGENGGCNADASRYSFGNVIGPVRISPGEWAITTSEVIELTIDEPFAFERYRHPFNGFVDRYLGQFETREGLFVFISLAPLRGTNGQGFNRFQALEFLVLNSPSLELGDNVVYHEYDRTWSISAPIESIFGTLEEQLAGSSTRFPIVGEEVALFHCRDRDGLIATAVTDSDGEFRFDGDALGLFDGNYQLRFPTIPGLDIVSNRFTIFENHFSNCADFDSPDNRRSGWQGRAADQPISVRYLQTQQ